MKNQREVAKLIDVGSGSVISKHLKLLRDYLVENKKLGKLMTKVERRLDAERASIDESH